MQGGAGLVPVIGGVVLAFLLVLSWATCQTPPKLAMASPMAMPLVVVIQLEGVERVLVEGQLEEAVSMKRPQRALDSSGLGQLGVLSDDDGERRTQSTRWPSYSRDAG